MSMRSYETAQQDLGNEDSGRPTRLKKMLEHERKGFYGLGHAVEHDKQRALSARL
jgi:hypothetical protein